ncbi:dihydrolipoyllysine-residue succinyltransferase [Bombella sp. TMW 2.2543]|uniref:Dihydrolipoyllysine-residue succinyltransferase n=1 Tax=Bombella pluederhausensis TaxID=2967336 RepID=A0ABT3WHJ2_9PROT|nr:dihydrolipoyllysine-residue succinyltransferase [Bombella pluederhausensis]MCX5618353.1 dihydrolipoyllysine-residue succinyltransferase [Bombella pluederhausensis]
MAVEIKIPVLGESLKQATVMRWLKQSGEYVQAGETVLELETDKVTLDVPAPVAGQLSHDLAEGTDVDVGQVVAFIDDQAVAPVRTETPSVETHQLQEDERKLTDHGPVSSTPVEKPVADGGTVVKSTSAVPDVRSEDHTSGKEGERRVPMSRLRQTIARNLKAAQNNAAILTTFNEVDMSAVKALRGQYRDLFEKKHDGARLGFMSFFARAVVGALKDFPVLNARIEGNEIVYQDHVNLGIAVGTERGLVVPVLRKAETLGFAELERQIADYGKRARKGGLALKELEGGSFTITNGGIFGSLLSTPILNAPQSGVLGMHAIQDRPVARDGQVVIRPMMYVALSYDHRLVDGREAVSFLVRLKELIEDPRRLLLDI